MNYNKNYIFDILSYIFFFTLMYVICIGVLYFKDFIYDVCKQNTFNLDLSNVTHNDSLLFKLKVFLGFFFIILKTYKEHFFGSCFPFV